MRLKSEEKLEIEDKVFINKLLDEVKTKVAATTGVATDDIKVEIVKKSLEGYLTKTISEKDL